MEIQRYKKRVDKKKKSLVIYKLSYHHIKVKWNVLALFLFINIYEEVCEMMDDVRVFLFGLCHAPTSILLYICTPMGVTLITDP